MVGEFQETTERIIQALGWPAPESRPAFDGNIVTRGVL